MKKNGKLNSFSLSTFILSINGAPFWGILTSFILSKSKNDTPLSLLIGFIIGTIISLILLKFFSTYPDLIGALKIKKIYGKFSIVINTIIGILGITLYILLTYRLAVFLSSQYLVDRQSIYFYILIVLLTFYMANKGLETITRVSIILFYIALFIFVFDLVNLAQYIKIDNLYPLFTTNIKDILNSSINYSTFSTIPIIFILGFQKSNLIDANKFNKYYFVMYSLSFIILFLSIIAVIGTLGINLSVSFSYPIYTVLKKIELLSFLESIENISVMIWIIYTINASSIILLSIINNLSAAYNLKVNKNIILKIVLFIITILLPYILFLKNNYTDTYEYLNLPTIILSIILFLIIMTLIINKIKKN